jgi:hypothetical protein
LKFTVNFWHWKWRPILKMSPPIGQLRY